MMSGSGASESKTGAVVTTEAVRGPRGPVGVAGEAGAAEAEGPRKAGPRAAMTRTKRAPSRRARIGASGAGGSVGRECRGPGPVPVVAAGIFLKTFRGFNPAFTAAAAKGPGSYEFLKRGGLFRRGPVQERASSG